MSASKINFEIRTELSLRRFDTGPGYFSAELIVLRTVSIINWPDSGVKVADMHHKLKREVDEVVRPIYKKFLGKHVPLPLVLAAILVIPGVTEVQEIGEYSMRVFREKETSNNPKKK